MDCVINETIDITDCPLLAGSRFEKNLQAENPDDRKITKLKDAFLVKLAVLTSEDLSILVDYRLINSKRLADKMQCLALDLIPTTPLKEIYDFIMAVDDLDLLDHLPNKSTEAYLTHRRSTALDAKLLTTLARHDPSILLTAIEHKKLDVGFFLIDNGVVDIEHTSPTGETALIKACKYGMETMVAKIIKSGRANLDHEDDSGDTAFTHACNCGAENVALHLINSGYELDRVVEKNTTALLSVCGWGNKTIALMKACDTNGMDFIALTLLSAGCDPKRVNRKKQTALTKAISNGLEAVALMLFALGCELPRS